jgi:hypothetical protein
MTNTALPFTADVATRQTFDNMTVPLSALFRQMASQGVSLIQNRAFNGCRIEGPALMLVLDGVVFQNCDMGPDGGDVRNLLLRPMGSKVIGAVPFAMCLFDNCTFHAVGFTGEDRHLQAFQSALGRKG